MANIPNRIVVPLHGDDFNDDLLKKAARADYDSVEITSEGSSTADNTAMATSTTDPESATDALATATEALTNPPDLTKLGTLLGASSRRGSSPWKSAMCCR